LPARNRQRGTRFGIHPANGALHHPARRNANPATRYANWSIRMEKICRVLYKHERLQDWIAFEVYLRRQPYLDEFYEAYWTGPLNERLFYENDYRLDALQRKLGALVEEMGYSFFCRENQN
jgi:hypothetical protein